MSPRRYLPVICVQSYLQPSLRDLSVILSKVLGRALVESGLFGVEAALSTSANRLEGIILRFRVGEAFLLFPVS